MHIPAINEDMHVAIQIAGAIQQLTAQEGVAADHFVNQLAHGRAGGQSKLDGFLTDDVAQSSVE